MAKEIYSPNQKLAHGWKCSVNDVMKLSRSDAVINHTIQESRTRASVNGDELWCRPCARPSTCPCQKSKQMYIWIFSFSPPMLHKPVATEMMHRAAGPPSILLITLSVNSLQLSYKYFCWGPGCYSQRGSTQSRPS